MKHLLSLIIFLTAILSIQAVSVSQTFTPTAFQTGSGTYSPSISISVSNSLSNSLSITLSTSGTFTTSNTLSNTISNSLSISLTNPAALSRSPVYGAPPNFMNACPQAHTIACLTWGNDAKEYFQYYILTIVVANSGNVPTIFNITNTFAVTLEQLSVSTTYSLTLQGFLFGYPSQLALLTIVTLPPDVKINPALGITAFSCLLRTTTVNKKKQKFLTCGWTNGVIPYLDIETKIKCQKGNTGSLVNTRPIRRIIKEQNLSSFTVTNLVPKYTYKCNIRIIPRYAGANQRDRKLKASAQG